MSGALRLVLGDQLARSITSLADLDPARDVVLMAEVMDEVTYVKHHKLKIFLYETSVFIFKFKFFNLFRIWNFIYIRNHN